MTTLRAQEGDDAMPTLGGCECGAERYCPQHRYRWEYEQDEARAHEALDYIGAARVAGPAPGDLVLSVAGRVAALPKPWRQRWELRLRAASHELSCWECRVTWRSWAQRLVGNPKGQTP